MSAGGIIGSWNGAVQTSYYTHPNQGVPGLMVHINEPREIWGYPVDNAAPFVACGRAVIKGTPITIEEGQWGTTNSPHTILPVSGTFTAVNFVGIAVWDEAAEVMYETFTPQAPAPTTPVSLPVSGYRGGRMMSVLREGSIWVRNYGNVTGDSSVYVVINETNPLNAKFGEFVPAAMDGAAIALPYATWVASDTFATSKVAIVKIFGRA